MFVSVGHSDDPNPQKAAEKVLAKCMAEIGDQPVVGVIAYLCHDFDHGAFLAVVGDALPGVPVMGCTTDGEISSELDFSEDSSVLIVLAGDKIQARLGVGRDLSSDVNVAARSVSDQLRGHELGEPSLYITLAESIGVSGARVVKALADALPNDAPLVGGTAGDQWAFERTHQFIGREVVRDSVLVMALYGDLEVSVGVASGWNPIGRQATVTRADAARVYELDGQPAAHWFHTWFSDSIDPNPDYPFAVHSDGGEFYLRAPMATNEDGSIQFAGDVEEGSTVQLTEAGRDEILHGAAEAIAKAESGMDGKADAMLIFSCAARKQVLGTQAHKEVSLLRQAAGMEIPAAGFYSYGEIAPLVVGAPPRFHNETVVAVLLKKKAA